MGKILIRIIWPLFDELWFWFLSLDMHWTLWNEFSVPRRAVSWYRYGESRSMVCAVGATCINGLALSWLMEHISQHSFSCSANASCPSSLGVCGVLLWCLRHRQLNTDVIELVNVGWWQQLCGLRRGSLFCKFLSVVVRVWWRSCLIINVSVLFLERPFLAGTPWSLGFNSCLPASHFDDYMRSLLVRMSLLMCFCRQTVFKPLPALLWVALSWSVASESSPPYALTRRPARCRLVVVLMLT